MTAKSKNETLNRRNLVKKKIWAFAWDMNPNILGLQGQGFAPRFLHYTLKPKAQACILGFSRV